MVYGGSEAHGEGGKCLICDQDAEEIIDWRLFEFHLYCSSAIHDKPGWCADYTTSGYSPATNSLPILLSPYQLNRYLKISDFRNSEFRNK